jgi:hypothetical protein
VLGALWVVCLPAHALATLVGAFAPGQVEDLLDRVGLAVVDQDCADLVDQRQPVGQMSASIT